jgi:protein disulfide isomerase family A protein 3
MTTRTASSTSSTRTLAVSTLLSLYTYHFLVDNVKEFVNDYVAGKLKPYIKSEPVPAESNDAVKVVVGETFNDIVMDKNKDVLIELYAPWCGHCKNLEPTYKELAEKLKEEAPSVVIAKMDATANDSPHGKYQAKGFPTILFAPANDKENPVAYSGERTVKGFTDFLKEKSAIKWPKK